MWRQVPYPLDEPPIEAAAPFGHQDRFLMGGRHLEIAWDRRTGRATRLRHRRTGTDFLADDGPGITFRLFTRDGVWLEGTRLDEAPRVVADERAGTIVLLLDRPSWFGHRWPLRLRLEVQTRGDDGLTFSYEIEHLGAETGRAGTDGADPHGVRGEPGELIIERVQWPVLALDEFAGERTQLLLPFIGGERRPAPLTRSYADFEYVYPNEAMSFMDLYSPEEGLYLASYDARFLWTVLRGRRAPRHAPRWLELTFETTPFLRPRETFRSQPFVVAAHEGDWHAAADRYRREWLDEWWSPPETPRHIKEMNGLVELFFEFENADGLRRWDETTLIDYMTRCHDEMGLEVAHVCGYHEGGFDARYPLYEPLDRLGGAAGLRDFLNRCNAQPGWTTDIYLNCRIMDMATDWWQEIGRRWSCVSKDGTYAAEAYNTRLFAVACPAHPDRVRFWADKVTELIDRYGARGLQVDQPHTTAREDWAFAEHGHRSPFDHWGRGMIALLGEMRRRLRARDPAHWSWGEAASDLFSQYFDFSCIYTRFPEQRVFFGETDPATREWVDDERGHGAPEVIRYVCPEIPMLQAPLLDPDRSEEAFARLGLMWIYSVMLYWPGVALDYDLDRVPEALRCYLARLWRVRRENADLLVHGRFIDDRGLTLDDQSVYAKRYVAGPETAVLALNRSKTEQCRVTIDVALADGSSWGYRAASLASDPVVWREGTGPRAVLDLAPERTGIVVWRPVGRVSSSGTRPG